MHRILLVLFVLSASCMTLHKATYKVEEEHNALYKQKALFVYDVTGKKVLLSNPTCTRCYFLKGKSFVQKWQTGDTMIIDCNLTDFYDLRYDKCPYVIVPTDPMGCLIARIILSAPPYPYS